MRFKEYLKSCEGEDEPFDLFLIGGYRVRGTVDEVQDDFIHLLNMNNTLVQLPIDSIVYII